MLCSAQDLTNPGWAWSTDAGARNRWIVDGHVVTDDEVSGVFLRRSCVYPEELRGTHPDDREYLAAETTAFLTFVLACTRATVCNPVADGGFGEAAVRPERSARAAASLGLDVAPVRLKSDASARLPAVAARIEVVGRKAFGTASKNLRTTAIDLAVALGLRYAAFAFDTRGRLLGVQTLKPPSADARRALGLVLAGDVRP